MTYRARGYYVATVGYITEDVDMSFLGFAEETKLVAWGRGKVLELQLKTNGKKYVFDENGKELSGNSIIFSINR